MASVVEKRKRVASPDTDSKRQKMQNSSCEKPPVGLMDLPRELRDEIWSYVVESWANQLSVNRTNTEWEMAQKVPAKLRQILFQDHIEGFPKLNNKQILDEVTLAELRHVTVFLRSEEGTAMLNTYLSTFPEQQAYQQIRHIKIQGHHLKSEPLHSITNPISLIKRCSGLRSIEIDGLDMEEFTMRESSNQWMLPEQWMSTDTFLKDWGVAKICTLPGPLTVKIEIIWYIQQDLPPMQWAPIQWAQGIMAPYIKSLQDEIDRTGARITLDVSLAGPCI